MSNARGRAAVRTFPSEKGRFSRTAIPETQKETVLQWIEKRNGEAVAPVAAGCYAVPDAVLFPQPL